VPTGGRVAPGFEAVAAAFERNFTERGELGAAFAAYRDGVPVVDLWGGGADSEGGRPWESQTLAPILSGTKGLVATCLLLLLERGALDLEAPVARYWPEFAAHGKETVLVRHVVSHTAGLPGIRRRAVTADDLLDHERMAALLAEEDPVWDPGSVLCYHPLTYGWLCGELVRRVDGRTVGAFFADEVATMLELEAWIGLRDGLEERVARLELEPGWGRTAQTDPERLREDPVNAATWGNPPILLRDGFDWNSPALHRAGMPGAGGVAHARSMARFYGCLAHGGELDGVRLLLPETIAAATRPLARGDDPLTGDPHVYATGFELQTDGLPLGPSADGFGHGGAGGSLHGGWPSRGIGFSYLMNQMRDDEVDERSATLLRALFEAVA
jgi:CubicO group peptidase (beta-lactamase class C family)